MRSPLPSTIGLFPLGLVLLPGEILPLHIFEERYKRLIRECRETGDPFGVVLHWEDGMASVGCAARVVDVLAEYPDGRLDILVEGGERFQVVEPLVPDEPDVEPLRGVIDELPDTQTEAPAEAAAEVDDLVRRALDLLGGDAPEDPAGDHPVSFRVASAVDLEPLLKQQLLQLSDEGERLALVRDALREIVPRLELWRAREQAIRGNGKGN